MTPALVTTVAVCAVLGYVVVSWLLNRLSGKAPPSAGPQEQTKEEPPEQPRAKDEPPKQDWRPPPPPPPPPPPWHEVLDVAETASEEEVKAAYRLKIRMYHPDRVASLGPEFQALAEAKAKGINAAYQDGLKAARRRPS